MIGAVLILSILITNFCFTGTGKTMEHAGGAGAGLNGPMRTTGGKTMLRTTVLAPRRPLMLLAASRRPKRWAGGDDLADQPARLRRHARHPRSVEAYDGGQPTNPPDRKGKAITVVDVPKLIGIGYFDATSKGMPRRPPSWAT